MDKPKPDAPITPTNQPGPAPSYMTSPPGSDKDSLGRPWPDVQVKPGKPRRRKR